MKMWHQLAGVRLDLEVEELDGPFADLVTPGLDLREQADQGSCNKRQKRHFNRCVTGVSSHGRNLSLTFHGSLRLLASWMLFASQMLLALRMLLVSRTLLA